MKPMHDGSRQFFPEEASQARRPEHVQGGEASAGPLSYSFLLPAIQPDEIGRLANYRVLRLLGKGGMGVVFHAEDLALGRSVALKVMQPKLAETDGGWQRFLREARTMAAIKDEHFITIYQAGQEGDVVWFAMELLEGESLESRLKRVAQLEAGEIVRLGREIASGLAAIHKKGLVHRDIKPDNIWLEAPRDRVKILDFGLVRSVGDDSNLTQTGAILGTPAYMSPEQARSDRIDARSDLFSLGSVLYRLCTGLKPFRAENTLGMLTALAVDNPRPVRDLNPAVPPRLAGLVMQLLEKDPDDRPASAEAVLGRLERIEGEGPGPTQTGERFSAMATRLLPGGTPQRRLPQWASLPVRRWLPIGLGALLVVVAVAGFLLLKKSRSPADIPEADRIYLSTLKPIEAVGWPWKPPGGKDPPIEHVHVNGIFSAHGIFMHPEHAPTSLSYRLGKQYRTFGAQVSPNDSAGERFPPLTFSVYGDGKLLWGPTTVSTREEGVQNCLVPVDGVEVLKLEVRIVGHPQGAHAAWVEPFVAK
jgi:serine/threonine protein kinase